MDPIKDKQLLGKSKSETKAPVCVQKVSFNELLDSLRENR